MIRQSPPATGRVVMEEEVTDPVEIARAQAQHARMERNWAAFGARAAEVYASCRGKCVCVAGGELFVADTPEEALGQATVAHPEDDGRFLRYIPRERMARVYANQRIVAPLRWRRRAPDSPRPIARPCVPAPHAGE